MTWSQLVVWHAVPTLFLCGLIWFVQVVHYALYPAVGAAQFVAYERAHCRRITPLVLPAMLSEAVLAGWLLVAAPAGTPRALAIAGACLLAAIWAATLLLQVPCHARLEQAADVAAMRRLVRSNWLRTGAWTLRGATAVWLLLLLLP